MNTDRAAEAFEQFESGLTAARARGDRPWEILLLAGQGAALFLLGRWDELAEVCEPLMNEKLEDVALAEVFALFATLLAARGNLEALDGLVAPAGSVESADTQVRNMIRAGQAAVAQAEGRSAEAIEIFRSLTENFDPQARRHAYIAAVDAACALDDEAAIGALIGYVEQLPPVEATALLRGGSARLAGVLAAKRGDVDAAEARFDEAVTLLRELGYPFELAKALLDRGEALQRVGRVDEAALFIEEARATFAELGARPSLERAEAALARPASAA
jgi:tetratricopeptide (TPR) repeat protein